MERGNGPADTLMPDAGSGREVLRLFAVAVVFLALAVLAREQFHAVREWLAGLGPWAPLAFLGVHAVAVPLGFPVSVLGFLAGATFGFLGGTLLLLAAGLGSGCLIYLLGRGLFADRVRRYASRRPRLARFLELADRDSVRLVVLLRLSPLHYALVSYLLGAARVRFGPYVLASGLILPSAAAQAYVGQTARIVGDRLRAGEQLGPWRLALATVAVVAAVLLVVLLGRLVRRAIVGEVAAGTGGEGEV
ncbi:MAG TPA: VTT domain-containing protein [Candidatus Krumholzibacteria bacterium]|nr:VTT domain-containing protein [Candidatus Krumholzibacteria bacterium]HPD71673.1 VTT domain-containing protein [Candidatus Krumholzibacteria bacterium]HRY41394.1 VTT domain-containing protein [Candidatus Krumholzibacteria bacterium]